jgi:hypothetical protein
MWSGSWSRSVYSVNNSWIHVLEFIRISIPELIICRLDILQVIAKLIHKLTESTGGDRRTSRSEFNIFCISSWFTSWVVDVSSSFGLPLIPVERICLPRQIWVQAWNMMATNNTKTTGARLIIKDSIGYNNQISQTYKPAASWMANRLQ